MSRWPLRYHFLKRDELVHELFALCLLLRRPRPSSELRARPPAGGAEAGSDVEGSAARRCYISKRECADFDFPRVLEADERARALIGTLNEAASLLRRFAQSERSTERRNRHFRS